MNQFAIHAFFTPNEMPLKFYENIFAAKRVDQKLRAIREILGSAGVSRVGFGVAPKPSFLESRISGQSMIQEKFAMA